MNLNELKLALKTMLVSRQWEKRPQLLSFEITAACDSRCIHCPRQGMDRLMKAMNFELFKKIIDQACEMKIPELSPNGYGEILMVKNLEAYFEYISAKKHKFKININTNGNQLTDDKINLFIDHNVRSLNICLDGATKETIEKVRVKLSAEQMEANVLRVMELKKQRGRKHPLLRLGMVVIPENQHEKEAFLQKWQGKVDAVGLVGYSNRGGSLNERFGNWFNPTHSNVCILPFSELFILSDGKAVLCCNDWNEEHLVGDLNHQSLQEVWSGPALQWARYLHKKRQGNQMEICKNCNYWKNPTIGTRLHGPKNPPPTKPHTG